MVGLDDTRSLQVGQARRERFPSDGVSDRGNTAEGETSSMSVKLQETITGRAPAARRPRADSARNLQICEAAAYIS